MSDILVDDEEVVKDLFDQITGEFDTFLSAGAYDGTLDYDKLLGHSLTESIVIPSSKNAIVKCGANEMRNRKLFDVAAHEKSAASEIKSNQEQEFIVGYGALNKMIRLGVIDIKRVV